MFVSKLIGRALRKSGNTNNGRFNSNQSQTGTEEEELESPTVGYNFVRRKPSDSVDGDHENAFADRSVSEIAETCYDTDIEIDPPEWELGIRRSSKSENSNENDLTLSDVILDPDGNVAYYWLSIVTVAVVYNIAVVILRLAFIEMRNANQLFYVLDSIGDIIYMMDVAIQFRISFYEDGCLVLHPDKISQRYMSQSRFIFDIAAILPIGTLISILTAVSTFLYICISSSFLDILPVLARLPRLLKYPAMARFFDATDSRTNNPYLVRALKLSLYLWTVIHWIGCIYYMVSLHEGLGVNAWVYPGTEDYSPFLRKYIRVTYWSLMTLTTIGERPSPETDLEFVFTGLTFLIGVFLFAAVVGNVGDVISNINAARQEYQSRMDHIKFYLHHRRVPTSLQNRVKRWADYTWSRTQAIDEPTLLQMLPDRLRTEIAINVHLETLKKVKIFEECEESLLHELVLKLRAQIYSPGDYICRIGEIGREMFIVNHGKVEILVPNAKTRKRMVVATLTPGNYFGEISLLKLDEGQNRRTADVRSVGFSELLRLSRRDLMSALVEYPQAKKILEAQAKERMNKTKQVRTATVDESSSLDQSANDPPHRKKDILQQLVKSDSFRKLLSSKNNEVTELRLALDELKSFDSQVMKRSYDQLTSKCDELQCKLDAERAEHECTKAKLNALESRIRQASSPHNSLHADDSRQSERSCHENGYCRLNQTFHSPDIGSGIPLDTKLSANEVSSSSNCLKPSHSLSNRRKLKRQVQTYSDSKKELRTLPVTVPHLERTIPDICISKPDHEEQTGNTLDLDNLDSIDIVRSLLEIESNRSTYNSETSETSEYDSSDME
ncbi:hypothetical protein CHS0354_042707 [Potamilus streckersoni]|uniref:Cyclic nucleotide-binding domain-containing protein n=1 Tax=Potamilus streckersoni TaxID=2493646 RepID=A0AAE0S984_9BIVA|nr:hypothetical protein CHS0354_042707 [Potamilus streckersoni]